VLDVAAEWGNITVILTVIEKDLGATRGAGKIRSELLRMTVVLPSAQRGTYATTVNVAVTPTDNPSRQRPAPDFSRAGKESGGPALACGVPRWREFLRHPHALSCLAGLAAEILNPSQSAFG